MSNIGEDICLKNEYIYVSVPTTFSAYYNSVKLKRRIHSDGKDNMFF